MEKVIHFVSLSSSMKGYVRVQSTRRSAPNGTKYLSCKLLILFCFIFYVYLNYCYYYYCSKIKDIHEVLEVTIYDEDKDRCEFLGKVAIPLLKVIII